MTDLHTTWLGLDLATPIVASSSPLTGDLDHLIALEAAGVGAAVLPSLFEEQVVHESLAVHDLLEFSSGAHAEAVGGYLPEMEDYNTGTSGYLRHLEAAKARLSIPIVASLNGVTRGGWLQYARLVQESGADAIELNIYRVVADAAHSGAQVEEEVIDLVAGVTSEVTIPVAVKLGPQFSSLPHLAMRIADAGAAGLSLFNRFYQPDIDLETLDVTPDLVLSSSQELRLPLRWIAILHGRTPLSLAATTGVHTWRDVAKVLLAGADVAMMASALLRNGPDHVGQVLHELEVWADDREYDGVRQFVGSVSQRNVAEPSAFERANYLRTLTRYAGTFL